jgi:hypothetical protein
MGHVRTGSPSGIHDDAVIALALAAWWQPPDEVPLKIEFV